MLEEFFKNVDLTEFNKLAKMLEDAGIPHSNSDESFFNGRQIILFNGTGKRLADVICHRASYGHEKGLLEIMGALTVEEYEYQVLGCLTAEEVFKRFKYCYEHNTSVYVEDDND